MELIPTYIFSLILLKYLFYQFIMFLTLFPLALQFLFLKFHKNCMDSMQIFHVIIWTFHHLDNFVKFIWNKCLTISVYSFSLIWIPPIWMDMVIVSFFVRTNSGGIWYTLSCSRWQVLSWLIIFPLAYKKTVNLPLLSGARDCINSVMSSEIGMWLRWPSWDLLTFSVYLGYNSKHIFGVSTFD